MKILRMSKVLVLGVFLGLLFATLLHVFYYRPGRGVHLITIAEQKAHVGCDRLQAALKSSFVPSPSPFEKARVTAFHTLTADGGRRPWKQLTDNQIQDYYGIVYRVEAHGSEVAISATGPDRAPLYQARVPLPLQKEPK